MLFNSLEFLLLYLPVLLVVFFVLERCSLRPSAQAALVVVHRHLWITSFRFAQNK